MTVTVGIPTKNERATIIQTVEALRAQTRAPDRVILADSSDDGTAYASRVAGFTADFDIDVVTPDAPGIGAAREAIRDAFDGGLLVCLDANLEPSPEWLATHVRVHDRHPDVGVVNGTWRARQASYLVEPGMSEFFVQANCSIKPWVFEEIGGWDPAFRRGEEWDFHCRLAQSDIPVYATDRASVEHIATEGDRVHLRKVLDRPGSLRYLRKYGPWYARFHPKHVLGDALSAGTWVAAIANLWPLAGVLFAAGTVGTLLESCQPATAPAEFLALGPTAIRGLLRGVLA